MASSAFWAFGSKLQLGDGATSEAFTDIAEITELQAPQMSKDSIEVTNHSTSTNGWREFLPGLKDGGEISAVANWLPTNATHNSTTGLLESFSDDDLHNWKIILPDTLLTISFSGFLTAFNPDLPLDAQGQLSFTIKISGQVTVA